MFDHLFMFEANTGDGGGATDPPAGEAGELETPTGGETPGDGTTFTQADLNRIVGQAKRKALAAWAKEHGFDDPKGIEELIAAKKEADDKSKTDLEKASAREREALDRATATEARMRGILLKSEFRLKAAEQVADLDLAYLAAQDMGLLNGESGIEIDLEAGTVKGVDKAVEKLLKAKPLLKKVTQAAPAGTGGAAGGVTLPPGQMTPEQEAAYKRRFGIR